ncbi:hypothetical protein IL306_005249 [Fusarium sp. DS 682]|nr:hypothetical protein IL306_005249 [Fusarium sp. DS 682]
MAARPGEENVATLFDKGSYVYLFENANERRCRVEIANQPGTDDQDAFEGYLDQTHVRYSYKQQCTVTLTGPEAVADQNEWHLPTFDPQNQNKYHYKLHSLDIYFWTQADALQFVNGVRRVVPPSHVEVLDEPGPPPQPAPMSSVVQQLENVAISDPQYGSANAPSFAPPPTVPAPPPAPPSEAPASFVPMAYNPAAPAAPETIQHREKTPPPDEDPLNPLAVAVAYDYQKQPFTPGMPPPSQFPPGGVTSPGLPPPQFGQHPGLQRAATMPAQALGSPYGATFPGSPGFVSPPPPQTQPPAQAQPHSQPTPPVSTPGLPPPPPGGFTQHNYTHQEQQAPIQPGPEYSVHQQVYRPTQTEVANSEIYSFAPKTKEPRGKLEENAGRLERGVTGMLKKFEKKFG